jgi:hypothetical protein
MMRKNKLLVTLAFSMLFGSGVTIAGELSEVSSEPTKCYQLAWNNLELNTGQAVKLCSGTTDAVKTIECFIKAYGHPDDEGLGLYMGAAVNLCKSNSEPFRKD